MKLGTPPVRNYRNCLFLWSIEVTCGSMSTCGLGYWACHLAVQLVIWLCNWPSACASGHLAVQLLPCCATGHLGVHLAVQLAAMLCNWPSGCATGHLPKWPSGCTAAAMLCNWPSGCATGHLAVQLAAMLCNWPSGCATGHLAGCASGHLAVHVQLAILLCIWPSCCAAGLRVVLYGSAFDHVHFFETFQPGFFSHLPWLETLLSLTVLSQLSVALTLARVHKISWNQHLFGDLFTNILQTGMDLIRHCCKSLEHPDSEWTWNQFPSAWLIRKGDNVTSDFAKEKKNQHHVWFRCLWIHLF